MSTEQEAIANAANMYQGKFKRVLCVCSAGLLRSATAAVILSQEPYNFNTRTCGVESYALIPISMPLIAWADEIVCMGGEEHAAKVRNHPYFKFRLQGDDAPKLIILNIPDRYAYRNEELIKLITKGYNDVAIMEKANAKPVLYT